MKSLIVICLLLCLGACSVNQNKEQEEPEITTAPAITTTTSIEEVEFPSGELLFEGILPNDIKDIYLSNRGMNVHFKTDKVKNEFIEFVSGLKLYSEYAGVPGFLYEAPTIFIEDTEGKMWTYYEDLNIIEVKVRKDGRLIGHHKYGYYPKDKPGKALDYLMYKWDEYYNLLGYNLVGNGPLTIVHAENEDILIESELGDLGTYQYGWIDDIAFKELGFQIFEGDEEWEALPASLGEHFVILKKDGVTYQLKYKVVESEIN